MILAFEDIANLNTGIQITRGGQIINMTLAGMIEYGLLLTNGPVPDYVRHSENIIHGFQAQLNDKIQGKQANS